jgi:rhodanese-related sulfurtransferase
VLGELGFTNVAHLEPGFNAWVSAGGDVEDVASTSRWVKRDL